MRAFPMALIATALIFPGARAAELPAVVQKPAVDVYAQPAFDAPKVTTLSRDAAVTISAQQGLWYQLQMPTGTPGYVRVNDVRINPPGTGGGDANLRVLMGGKAGQGRVTETAGVRGIDESDLKSAAFDQTRLSAMLGYRVVASKAAAYASEEGWQATQVAYAGEAKRGKSGGKPAQDSAPSTAASARAVSGMLGSLGGEMSSMFSAAAKVAPKGEGELAAEELALGPEITGRILGARPLWDEALAQWRVNLVGQWVAAQTSRPQLPWTFGVIDTPEVNAFAAPGGYILVTRGLYELLSSDSELAAVLGHEISHCVQRDHYNVIDSVAGTYARRYAEEHGATIMLTALDREAEYRADEGAQVYLARAGLNPLALYSVLQKFVALGRDAPGLAQLYKTHPPFDARIDRIDQRGYGALEPYLTRE
jgi:hypothetical protein